MARRCLFEVGCAVTISWLRRAPVVLVFALASFTLVGCAVAEQPRAVLVDPPYLRPQPCKLGMLRMTKSMSCAEEFPRLPLWGLS